MVLLSYLQRFDTYCYCLCSGIRARPVAGRLAVWVSRSGDGYAYFAIALASVLLNDSGTAYFKHLLLAFLIELPIYWLLKSSFKRRRPSDLGLSLAALIVAGAAIYAVNVWSTTKKETAPGKTLQEGVERIKEGVGKAIEQRQQ